jgi:Flp pilus assembly protein CpaB
MAEFVHITDRIDVILFVRDESMVEHNGRWSDAEVERGFQKILAFRKAHPHLKKELDLWIADAATLEITNPKAAAICAREAPDLKG